MSLPILIVVALEPVRSRWNSSKINQVSMVQHSVVDLTHPDYPGSVAKGSRINHNNFTYEDELTYLDSGRFGVGQV